MNREQLIRLMQEAESRGDMDFAKQVLIKIESLQADPEKPEIDASQAAGSFEQGFMDPINAAGQLLERSVPDSVRNQLNSLNNYLVDTGLPLRRMGPGGLDADIREQEKIYQAGRAERGEEGFDYARLGGAIVPAVLASAATKNPVPMNSLLGRVGGGALAGGLFGALQPVTEGDFWSEKGKQVGVGAATGGVVPIVTGGLSRVVQPQLNKAADLLRREGVTMTPAQMKGGLIKQAEEKARSLPVVGDAIARAQGKGIESLNIAAINRSLAPIGEAIPKSMKAGESAIEYARKMLQSKYNRLLPNLTGTIDDQFKADISTIMEMGKSLPDDIEKQLSKQIKYLVMSRFTKYGKASGETLKRIESQLGQKAKGYIGAADPDKRDLGKALFEVQTALRDMVERANPQFKGELSKINAGWRQFAIVRDAASRQGAKEGVFSIGNLKSAVRKADSSAGKGKFAEGNVPMKDLVNAAESTLAQTIPDSGTPARLMMGGGLLGAGYIEPNVLAALAAGSLPYLSPKLTQTIVSARPQVAQPIASGIRNLGPYLTPGAVTATNSLINQ